MNERMIHLRVKVKSLAAEAEIIRREAQKTEGMVKWGLNQHRKTVVRYHSRINLLAYGLLRGIPYGAMEHKCHTPPDFDAIVTIARRFGGDSETVKLWVEEAKGYLTAVV